MFSIPEIILLSVMFVMIITCIVLLALDHAGDIFDKSVESAVFYSKEDVNGQGWQISEPDYEPRGQDLN